MSNVYVVNQIGVLFTLVDVVVAFSLLIVIYTQFLHFFLKEVNRNRRYLYCFLRVSYFFSFENVSQTSYIYILYNSYRILRKVFLLWTEKYASFLNLLTHIYFYNNSFYVEFLCSNFVSLPKECALSTRKRCHGSIPYIYYDVLRNATFGRYFGGQFHRKVQVSRKAQRHVN